MTALGTDHELALTIHSACVCPSCVGGQSGFQGCHGFHAIGISQKQKSLLSSQVKFLQCKFSSHFFTLALGTGTLGLVFLFLVTLQRPETLTDS